jgi:PKD repeat protein
MKARTILILVTASIGVVLPLKLALDASQAPIAEAKVGYEEEYPRASTGAETESDGRIYLNNLGPNEFTPANYVPPAYDPFNNPYNPGEDYAEKYPPQVQPNAKPEAAIAVSPKNRSGFQYNDTVTAGTEMRFDAYMSKDDETRSDRLRVRWDFESDGIPDTYFSTAKVSFHTYEKPGDYVATLEVLDRGGAVAKATKKIKVVNNTAPFAHQIAKVKSGTTATVFTFDASESSDSQYKRQFLEYRFDWDSDGIYDTIYKTKTTWRHKFDQAGNYRVTMEAKDPEGLTATWYQDISVISNTAPTASFTVNVTKSDMLAFDASASTDTESPKKLMYRWDFNYTGSDDIIFDTDFTTSPKRTGHYDIAGTKMVRLEVKDPDGAISDAYRTVVAD